MWISGGMFIPPGMGTGSVSADGTAASGPLISKAARDDACRRCSAKSFRTSNLVYAWLDAAADRASIGHRQVARFLKRGAARTLRTGGDGSPGRMCIATSLVFSDFPGFGRWTNLECLESALYARGQHDLAPHCAPGGTSRQPKCCPLTPIGIAESRARLSSATISKFLEDFHEAGLCDQVRG